MMTVYSVEEEREGGRREEGLFFSAMLASETIFMIRTSRGWTCSPLINPFKPREDKFFFCFLLIRLLKIVYDSNCMLYGYTARGTGLSVVTRNASRGHYFSRFCSDCVTRLKRSCLSSVTVSVVLIQ